MLSGVSSSLSISSPRSCCAVTHWHTVGQCVGLNWFITREFFLNGVSRFLLSKRLRDATVNLFFGIMHSHPEEKLEFRIHYAGRNAFWVYHEKKLTVDNIGQGGNHLRKGVNQKMTLRRKKCREKKLDKHRKAVRQRNYNHYNYN